MRTPLAGCTLLACAVLLPAQSEAYDKLVADYLLAAKNDVDAAVADFLPLFKEAADEVAGTEAAVPFLSWIVLNGRLGKPVAQALTTLSEQHTKSLAIGPVVDVAPQLATYLTESPVTLLLDGVLAGGSPPELHARALLARATMIMMRVKSADEESRAAAAKDLEQARKLTKDPALLSTIARIDTDQRSLAIGDKMPEVTGFDLDGLPFCLSDYRGKVVVLDFWGDW